MRGAATLTAEQALRLIESAATARDRAFIALCVESGLRVGEARQLRVVDIRFVGLAGGAWRSHVLVRRGTTKGQTQGRLVSLRPDVVSYLDAWLLERQELVGEVGEPDGAAPFFLAKGRGNTVGPMADRTARRIWTVAARRADIQNVSSHSGRKTFGQRLHDDGVPVQTVSALLGHRDVRHTSRYFEVPDEEQRAATLALPSLTRRSS